MTTWRDQLFGAELEVKGLTKTYRRAVVLDDVSFTCPAGAITGLLGPNGSGKTTIMRAITGLAKPDRGTGLFGGREYVDLPCAGAAVGVLMDASAHHRGRSVRETVALAASLMGSASGEADHLVSRMGLSAVASKRFGQLSLGLQQRVGLALAFLGDPQFLILDEPFNGLDVESTHWLRQTLVEFAHRRRGVVLVSSHLLQELQAYADRYVVISKGRVTAELSAESLVGLDRCEVAVRDRAELERSLRSRSIEFAVIGNDRLRVSIDSASLGEIALADNLVLTALLPGGTRALEDLYLSATQGEFRMRATGVAE